MNKLSNLKVYCITDKNGNVVFPFAKGDIPFGRFHAESDLRAWAIKEYKELTEHQEKLIKNHNMSVLDAEVSEIRGARYKLMEMFKITEEDLK